MSDETWKSGISEDLRKLTEGVDLPCHFMAPGKSEPDWLDKQKFREGQQFFRDNPLSVLMSCFRNLVIGLCVPNLW